MLSNNWPGLTIGRSEISCSVMWPWLAVVAVPRRFAREAVTTISLEPFGFRDLLACVDWLTGAIGLVLLT
ncbi:MAG: hypothetical protein ACXU7E_09290 [Croceibacterium sp.]